MQAHSLNITQDLITKLKEVVPGAFTEDKLNIDQLKQILGETINTDNERYHLDWAGKAEAFKVLQSPTTATLLPDVEASVDWDNAKNILIEGENPEALKALQKSYYGKVKMIYIDPPYNTGGDSFIYPDKFSETKEEYLRRIGDKDDDGYLMKEGFFRKNSKENGQFHSNWLNMMMPRLFLARNLLREDGVIFISIDDNEVHNLRLLMNEIFGEENFVANVIWEKKFAPSNDAKWFSDNHDHIVIYSKNKELFRPNLLERNEEALSRYKNPDNDNRGVWVSGDMTVKTYNANYDYEITTPSGRKVSPPKGICWRFSKDKVSELIADNRIWFGENGDNVPRLKRFLNDVKEGITPLTIWYHKDVAHNQEAAQELRKLFEGNLYFETPKPVRLIKRIVHISSKEDDIILDFFAGSGTTAQAVMELNEADGGSRKYICIQLPEKTDESSEAYKAGYKSIADISAARIKKVIDQIQAQRGGEMQFEEKQPLGFRKFTLAPSNFKLWRGDVAANEEELKKQMDMFASAQKEGAQTQNILWELLLKNGMPLTAPVQKYLLSEEASIYTSGDNRLAFVLDKYTDEVQPKLLELRPQTAVFLDSLFKGQDQAKTNLQLMLEESGITFKTI